MQNYLQDIVLRSGGFESAISNGFIQMTPVTNSFLQERLIERGPHGGWDEVVETKESRQVADHAQASKIMPPSTAQDQQLEPLTKAVEPSSPTYLKAQVQRGFADPGEIINTAFNHPFEEHTPIRTAPLVAPVIGAPAAAIATGEKQLTTIERQQTVAKTIFNKTDRKQSLQAILQPNAPFPMPVLPKTKQVEHKLVIGRITVEVVKPVVQTKERVVFRNHTPSPKNNFQERNKLSFGLGQL